jgi:phosphoserine phosphatase
MSHVATLIASPERPSIGARTIHAAQSLLHQAGGVRVLADGIAVDLLFAPAAGFDSRELARALRSELSTASAPFDVVVQPVRARRKRLFVADMDSTMIGQECIDELADYVGLKARVAAITERAMRGEIAFEPALRERVALLAGLPAGVIDEVLEKRITLTPGARTLVATMRAHGGYTCLVSGGFSHFTHVVAARIGFDEDRSNRLVIEEGKLAGRVEEPVRGRESKLHALLELTDRLRLDPSETLAVGDGANDLDMLVAAGLGVAFRAKPAVAAVAAAEIRHGDLTALLYLQGYRRDEFVHG